MKRLAAICLCLVIALAALGAPALASPLEDRYAPYGHARLHYTDQGAPLTTSAVVFIHGWSSDLTFWDAQVAQLSRERRVLALDLPGFGKSSSPKVAYTQDYLADGVEAVLAHAGVDRAVLVVHSMALAVAKRYMERHPGRVAGLFIVDGAYVDLPRDQQRADGVQKSLKDPAVQTPEGWSAYVSKFVTPMFSPATPPAARDKVMASMNATPRHVAISSLQHFMEPGSWNGVPVPVPARAVYSADMPAREGRAGYLALVFPHLRYEEWTGVGHFIMFDQPDRLNAAITEFVRQTLP